MKQLENIMRFRRNYEEGRKAHEGRLVKAWSNIKNNWAYVKTLRL